MQGKAIHTNVESRISTRRRLAAGVAIATGIASLLVVTNPFALAAGETFTVNSTADHGDASEGDGICDTGLGGGSPQCTLRAAIEEANAIAGHNTIEFDIAGSPAQVHTIQVGPSQPGATVGLPIIKAGGLTIDGYSQPFSSVNTDPVASNADIRIELRGVGTSPSDIDGLYFQSSDNEVRGLSLYNFRIAMRFWAGSETVTAERNLIVGNFIGTNAAGTFSATAKTTSGDGVHMQRGAANNWIGAPGPENRNVISGSSGRGVGVFNPESDDNIIENNIVGLNPSGTAALQNWSHGVDLNWGASSNIVRHNVISGNGLSGVEISHDALGQPSHGGVGDTELNVIESNLIGTDPTGLIASAMFGNGEYGVGLEGQGSCAFACPPDSNDNLVHDNVIVGSDVNVKIWRGSQANVVRNNQIGVLADGVTGSDMATEWGVLIEVGSIDNLIENNRISQVDKGIVVRPNSQNEGDAIFAVFGNTIRGNSIEDVGPGLGIDLAPEGAPTALPDPALVQHGVGFGDIIELTTDGARVSACDGCLVELFETTPNNAAHGQGRTSLGMQIATDGVAVFVFRNGVADPLILDEGQAASALVTDANGSTSEFSLRRTVAAGLIGPYVDPTATTTTTTTSTTTTTTVPTTPVPVTTVPGGLEPVPRDELTRVEGLASVGATASQAVRCSFSDTC